MSNRDPKAVQTELSDRSTHETGRQLMFNPETGEIVVVRPNERVASPDAVVASSIADEGFFGPVPRGAR
ncbi:MAG: hypothetical protein Q8S73_20345 [Deltaproteobacteria bacterium]|nr:hypothetical protein [Myxococcales bacterium]MDP3216470.1 hypothetical protein [Deltaproteobacteria bacterium]